MAGTVAGPCEAIDAEELSIVPLVDLLQACVREGTQRDLALLVTLGGHSTAYLFAHEERRVYHFDPMPASLTDVTGRMPSLARCPPDTEYNGLLLL